MHLSAHELSILLAMASALAAALANLYAKRLSSFARTRDFFGVNFLILTLLLLCIAPFSFQLDLRARSLGTLLGAVTLDAVANVLYFKAFRSLDASAASSLLSTAPVFTLIVALALGGLGPDSVAAAVLGVVMVVAGAMRLNALAEPVSGIDAAGPRALRLALLAPVGAALLFGVNAYVLKHVFTSGFTNPVSYYLLRNLVIAIAALVLLRPRLDWVTGRRLRLMTGRAILVIAQWLALLQAISIGDPLAVKTIAESTPLFVLLLAAPVLGERPTRRRAIGVVSIVLGVVLVGRAQAP